MAVVISLGFSENVALLMETSYQKFDHFEIGKGFNGNNVLTNLGEKNGK